VTTSPPALARHPLAIAGALIATASAVAFCALLIAALTGLFVHNPYAGLVVFVALPALLVLGLLLIPTGMWLQRRRLRRDPNAAAEWPVIDFRQRDVRRTGLIVTGLTAVNVVILLLAGYGGLHWMESPGFCGQTCHTPMTPQFTAWRVAAHGRIACATCHVGEGAGGFLRAKLSGVRQLVHVATDSFPRPIPPGADMPPGAQAQTCGSCHEPGRPVGDQVRVIREYAADDTNTETMTVLQMYMGAGSSRSIHWHADPAVTVEYVSTDAANETIPYVKVTDAKGQVKEYVTAGTTEQTISGGNRRRMDCIDCHNTVGHPISPTPERAVDQAIAAGLVSHQLPHVRSEGVKLLSATYSSQDEGALAIERGLRAFYDSRGASVDQQAVSRSAAALQDLYRRNVFPTMKVTWGSYPTNRGHTTSTGCFRCHDESHTAKDGSTISADCGYCHRQIER
jgi:hypothetical protein